MTARSFTFLIASTRIGGNAEILAHRAAAALPASIEQRWVRLSDYPLPPFQDTRHSTGFTAPEGNAKHLCDATLAATDLVFVAGVYWYSLPWTAKLYLDHWSAWMRIPELAFQKTLAGRSIHGIIVDSDTGAEGSSLPVVDTLRRTAEYMAMTWRGALVGHGNRPGEIENDPAAIDAAARYFAG